MHALTTNLAEHPFLQCLTDQTVELISRHMAEETVEAGQTIFEEGQPANCFYLVQSGRIALEWREPNHDLSHVQTLGPGTVLGWSWLFPPFRWHLKASALQRSRLARIDGAQLLALSRENPAFGYELMKRVAEVLIGRLQAVQQRLREAQYRLSPPPHCANKTSPAREIPPNESLKQRIARHPFLAGMDAGHLQTLADAALPVKFAAGQFIFEEGEIANRFYLIDQGEVSIGEHGEEGDSIAVQTIGPGDVLGWSWLFAPYYWHFDARALTPTAAIFFYGTRLRDQCEADHLLGCELMKRAIQVVMQRLESARQRLAQAPSK
jgi:CRP-like cAMP-binding protein